MEDEIQEQLKEYNKDSNGFYSAFNKKGVPFKKTIQDIFKYAEIDNEIDSYKIIIKEIDKKGFIFVSWLDFNLNMQCECYVWKDN